MSPQLRPMQVGGILHAWQSPRGNFKHVFLKLDLGCEPDNYPGIVIIADEGCHQAIAILVKNLRKEFPQLLKAATGIPVVYWWLERDVQEARRILSSLTEHPVFVG